MKSLGEPIEAMEEIAVETKILALNARLEVSRSNLVHNGFHFVAQQMAGLADEVGDLTEKIESKLEGVLSTIVARLESSVRQDTDAGE